MTKRSASKLAVLAPALICVWATAASADPIACPPARARGRDLVAWRESAIAKLAAEGNGGALAVQEAFSRCFTGASRSIPPCLRALEEQVAEQANGAPRTNRPTPLALSSEADLPEEFWVRDRANNVVRGKVQMPPNIFELGKERGWTVLDYKTRSTGGFDRPPNLLIVHLPNVPKPSQDVFLQISPPPDHDHPYSGAHPKPNPRKVRGQGVLTVITADKTTNPPVGQLRLMHGEDGAYEWNNRLTTSSCTNCHSSPLRAISPRGYRVTNTLQTYDPSRTRSVMSAELPMSPEDHALVDSINRAMRIDNLSWGFDGEGRRLGPPPSSQPLGWAPAGSPTREEAFIRSCFDRREDLHYEGFGDYAVTVARTEGAQLEDWVKLKNAMNCAGCHDGKARGPLHDGFSFNEVNFKVAVDRSMPQEMELTVDERLALLTCLKEERDHVRDEWRTKGEWMKKVSCGL